jgi:hypothetical protein
MSLPQHRKTWFGCRIGVGRTIWISEPQSGQSNLWPLARFVRSSSNRMPVLMARASFGACLGLTYSSPTWTLLPVDGLMSWPQHWRTWSGGSHAHGLMISISDPQFEQWRRWPAG